MKSLLVDAIRGASEKKSDSALSDSGSFDASNDELELTANEEHPLDEPRHDVGSDEERPLDEPGLGVTANEEGPVDELGLDPLVDETRSAGDGALELMATTDSLEAPVDTVDEYPHQVAEAETLSAEEFAYQTSHAVTIVGELPRPVPDRKAPAIARYSPLLSLGLAAMAAACWFLYQEFVVASSITAVDALAAQTRPAHTPGIPDAGMSGTERFPFLDIEEFRRYERTRR